MRNATELPQVARQHHHALTELCEAQANDSIIREIAGHVSPKMLAHYSHVRLDAKRKALDALSGGASGGSYGTNGDTNAPTKSSLKAQVIDKNGGADGIRTHDLLDAIEARSQLRHGPTEGMPKVYHSQRKNRVASSVCLSTFYRFHSPVFSLPCRRFEVANDSVHFA